MVHPARMAARTSRLSAVEIRERAVLSQAVALLAELAALAARLPPPAHRAVPLQRGASSLAAALPVEFVRCVSADEVRARLTRIVARVRASGVERAICFGHGHASRVLALCWLDFPIMFGQSFPLEVGSLSILGREKESAAILRWNS